MATLHVNLDAVAHNIRVIGAAVAPAAVEAVVKANAYGHGAPEVSLAALRGGATRLAVALGCEALALRRAGGGGSSSGSGDDATGERAQLRDVPLQVFAGFARDEIDELLDARCELTVTCNEHIDALVDAAVRARQHDHDDAPSSSSSSSSSSSLSFRCQPRIHVKFDTGMHRVGFACDDATVDALCTRLVDVQRAHTPPLFSLVGVMTHLATADAADLTYAHAQLATFDRVLTRIAARAPSLRFRYRHAANSGAIMQLPTAHYDLVRPGIATYGYLPSPETRLHPRIPTLRQAARWTTRLSMVKRVDAGAAVSYGCLWRAPRATTIATVAVGYADGFSRALTQRDACVLVGGRRVPVVGRVCMDMVMVDLGDNAMGARVDDEVVLLGLPRAELDDADAATIEMSELCEKLDTIPYEITCMVSARVRRVYSRDAPSAMANASDASDASDKNATLSSTAAATPLS